MLQPRFSLISQILHQIRTNAQIKCYLTSLTGTKRIMQSHFRLLQLQLQMTPCLVPLHRSPALGIDKNCAVFLRNMNIMNIHIYVEVHPSLHKRLHQLIFLGKIQYTNGIRNTLERIRLGSHCLHHFTEIV